MNEKILKFNKKLDLEKGKINMTTNELYINPYEKMKRLFCKKGSKFDISLTPSEFSSTGGLKLDNSEVDQNEALTRGYQYEQEIIKNSMTENKQGL